MHFLGKDTFHPMEILFVMQCSLVQHKHMAAVFGNLVMVWGLVAIQVSLELYLSTSSPVYQS